MSNQELLSQSWHQFIKQWLSLAKQQSFPEIETDPDWPSPCEFELDNKHCWRPVEQDGSFNFDNIEHALELTLDAEYKQFFTLYFSGNLNAVHKQQPLQLLQAWSEADFHNLQQNLIGHLMMKANLKQSPTLFFALTDEDDLNLVINQEGQVCLEYVGKEPHQVLSDSLNEFITELEPVI